MLEKPGLLFRSKGLLSGLDAYSLGLDLVQVNQKRSLNYGFQVQAAQVAGISSLEFGLFGVKQWKPFTTAMHIAYFLAMPGGEYTRFQLAKSDFQLTLPMRDWQFAAKLHLDFSLGQDQTLQRSLAIGLHRNLNDRTSLGIYTHQNLERESEFYLSLRQRWENEFSVEFRINQKANPGFGLVWKAKAADIRLFVQYRPYQLTQWQNEILVD